MTRQIAAGYRLVDGPPGVDDYRQLRKRSGLSPKSHDQAERAVAGGWTACHVVQDESRTTVGMGRVIGDGGWYFHIVDMAVLPEHQGRGLGSIVLSRLVDTITAEAPPDAYVTLLADPPGRRLYARHGFVETAPHQVGMVLDSRLEFGT